MGVKSGLPYRGENINWGILTGKCIGDFFDPRSRKNRKLEKLYT
jgi:hypothetical protein